ncbi:MAG: peptide chain release factor N(5)-glutamine methyltransferase [Desulfonauticus sp.]|nr:peptide chain release factor N(5)-glutamine methyltransferase [Desulfonauticus sp.]
MTYREALTYASTLLKQANIPNPALEASLLLGFVLNQSKEYIYTHPFHTLSPEQKQTLCSLIQKRIQKTPLAYLLGSKEFYGLNFKINPHVLIPRPETELIVEEVKKHFLPTQNFIFCDLGCGSGCIGLTIAKEFPNSKGVLLDISKQALQLAKNNSLSLNLKNHILFVQSNLKKIAFRKPFDLIVSNPPYIATKEQHALPEDVRLFEPRLALLAGKTGLLFYPFLKKLVKKHLKPGGIFVAEFGSGQTQAIQKMFSNFANLSIIKDLANKDRLVLIQKSI